MINATWRPVAKLTPLVLSVTLLGACGGENAGEGELSLAITDAPVDGATAVWVSYSGVAIQPDDGERIVWTFDERREINLLELQGSDSEALITDETVPAGRYAWIRLLSPQARITFEDGSEHPMFIPSGDQTGLKLQGGFTVPDGGAASYTIDFDLRRAVVQRSANAPGGEYILKPAHRLVDNADVGHIEGTVAIPSGQVVTCSPAAYLFAGADATTDDLGGSEAEPVTTAGIEMNAEGEFAFAMGFIPPGEYTVTWTCEAGDDNPEADDDISFEEGANVTVNAGETTTVEL